MMDFNLDFISNKHRKTTVRPSKRKGTTEDNVFTLTDRLIVLYNNKFNLIIRTAFSRIQFSRRLKAEKLQLLEQYILRRK